MTTLGIVLARAGSKGLPDKCVRLLRGRPVIEYTLDHALGSELLSAIVLSTDSPRAKEIAARRAVDVIDRPAALAHDLAPIDSAARHAVEVWELRAQQTVDIAVILYGNIPVRAPGLIDRAIAKLRDSGACSVRSVAPVGKFHPDWMHRLDGDRMLQYRPNSIYRRQDLEPLFVHDGAVVAVTRKALFAAQPEDNQSFLGGDRLALTQRPEDAIDIDGPLDFCIAEALLSSSEAGV